MQDICKFPDADHVTALLRKDDKVGRNPVDRKFQILPSVSQSEEQLDNINNMQQYAWDCVWDSRTMPENIRIKDHGTVIWL